ncbi:MAG: TonB protein [Pseudomonas sp.]|nr:TonB protein [Pseudomonas sp.]
MKLLIIAMTLLWSIFAQAHNVELVPTFKPDPIYPEKLKAAGIEGEVRIILTVQSTGSVKNLDVEESSHPEFSNSAERTVKTWRFEPWSTEGDNPSEVEAIVPVLFYFDKSK